MPPLEPSNLGQIIGRLMYPDLEDQAPAALDILPLSAPPARKGQRKQQLLELIRQRGPVSLREVVQALGISDGNASVLLFTLSSAGELKRTGEPRQYRYGLP